MCASSESVIDITFHQADSIQTFDDSATSQDMHVEISVERTSVVDDFHIGFQHDVVNIALT